MTVLAKATTCSEYGAMDSSARLSEVRSLIRAHDLDPNSNTYGAMMVKADVDGFCGVTFLDDEATKNHDSVIDQGVEWSEYGD